MEALISKKELLQRYGISYGALYRWKRMGLIPEDWFQRKATPTGQETFFYREQICPRVEQILSRGEISLEALAADLNEPQCAAPVRCLLVTDGFRTKSYSLNELRAIKLTEGTKTIDLLDYLKGVVL